MTGGLVHYTASPPLFGCTLQETEEDVLVVAAPEREYRESMEPLRRYLRNPDSPKNPPPGMGPHPSLFVTAFREVFLLFCRKKAWTPSRGLTVSLQPSGNISPESLAETALPVASIRALAELAGRQLLTTEVAFLAHLYRLEGSRPNRSWDDLIATSFARPGEVLPISARPDLCREPQPLPPSRICFGGCLASMESLPDTLFQATRTATFLGKSILEEARQQRWHHATDIPPNTLENYPSDREKITLKTQPPDAETLARENCQIEHGRTYPARAALRLAIEEEARAQKWQTLWERAPDSLEFGSLLRESDAAYAEVFPEWTSPWSNIGDILQEMVEQNLLIGFRRAPFGPLMGSAVFLCEERKSGKAIKTLQETDWIIWK